MVKKHSGPETSNRLTMPIIRSEKEEDGMWVERDEVKATLTKVASHWLISRKSMRRVRAEKKGSFYYS